MTLLIDADWLVYSSCCAAEEDIRWTEWEHTLHSDVRTCMEIFEMQSDDYKSELIPQRGCLKVTLEAGITSGWDKYSGSNGLSIGIDHFGLSAPYKHLADEFGFTSLKVEKRIRDHINKLL